ncbi:MAG TPA: hypothetical protein VKZ97_08870 [Flavobacteriaceae bacterium]|nr:hypothetical protein [Flavobacteriaceae bacterium]
MDGALHELDQNNSKILLKTPYKSTVESWRIVISTVKTFMVYTHMAERDLKGIKTPLNVAVEEITKTGKSIKNVLLSRNIK